MRTTPRLSDELNGFGVWEIRWSEVRGGSWRSMRKSTKTADREIAEMCLARHLADRGRADVQVRHKVADVIDAYLEHWSAPRGNIATDTNALRGPRLALGTMDPHSVTQDDVDAYVRARGRGCYGKVAVSSSTARREVTALQAALNWGSQKRLMVLGKPTFRFDKPAGGAPRVLWLTETQEAEVLAQLGSASRSVAAFTRMGLAYGARRGAMMDLRFGPQVDWTNKRIDFNTPGRRLTRKRRAAVPMTPDVETDLRVLHQARGDGAFVLERNTVDAFGAFMAEIGYGWVTPHTLKHTAVTLMRRGGVDFEEIAKVIDTDVRTLRQTYRHIDADEALSIITTRRR